MNDIRCFICGEPGEKSLGIRLRHANTNAVWAPNLSAHLCGLHGVAGAEIEIRYRDTQDGYIRVSTYNPSGQLVSRIAHEIGAKTTQESLI